MAQIKVVSVDKRVVTVDVAWEDGLSKTNVHIPDVPVESFEAAKTYLITFVSGLYSQAKSEADALAYANPTIAPEVLAAVGHTFDDQGNVLS